LSKPQRSHNALLLSTAARLRKDTLQKPSLKLLSEERSACTTSCCTSTNAEALQGLTRGAHQHEQHRLATSPEPRTRVPQVENVKLPDLLTQSAAQAGRSRSKTTAHRFGTASQLLTRIICAALRILHHRHQSTASQAECINSQSFIIAEGSQSQLRQDHPDQTSGSLVLNTFGRGVTDAAQNCRARQVKASARRLPRHSCSSREPSGLTTAQPCAAGHRQLTGQRPDAAKAIWLTRMPDSRTSLHRTSTAQAKQTLLSSPKLGPLNRQPQNCTTYLLPCSPSHIRAPPDCSFEAVSRSFVAVSRSFGVFLFFASIRAFLLFLLFF